MIHCLQVETEILDGIFDARKRWFQNLIVILYYVYFRSPLTTEKEYSSQ